MDQDYIPSLHAIETHDYFNIMLKNAKNIKISNILEMKEEAERRQEHT